MSKKVGFKDDPGVSKLEKKFSWIDSELGIIAHEDMDDVLWNANVN